MDRIKISDPSGIIPAFEIPYEWLPEGVQGPTLNDVEKTAERGSTTAYLVRVRAGEIPAASLEIMDRHSQEELYPLFSLLKLVKINIYYFEKYLNQFITREFYAQKPNPAIYRYPEDNNTDNIIYEPFTIEFAGYGDVNE